MGRAALLLVAIFLAMQGARASKDPRPEFTDEARERWTRLGFEGPLLVVDPRTGPASYLKTSAGCRKRAEQTVLAVKDYGYAASHSDQKKAQGARDRIARLQKAPGECANEINGAYAVTALATLSSFGWEYLPRDHTSLVGSVPPALYTGLLGAFLVNQNKVEFGPLGELNGKPILGSYRCENSRIRLDPTLAPMDLASHFIHEMDHLLRDKFPEPGAQNFEDSDTIARARQIISSLFNPADAEQFEREWREEYRLRVLPIMDLASLMMEESLASLQTSFRQVSLMDATFGKKHEPAYQIPGDLTLFSRDGPLHALWSQNSFSPYDAILGRFLGDSYGLYRKSTSPEERIFRDFYNRFMRARIDRLTGQTRQIVEMTQSWETRLPPIPSEVKEIHRRVFEVYFPRLPFDERYQFFLNPQFWTPEADPLYSRHLEVTRKAEDRMKHGPGTGNLSLPGITLDLGRTEAMIELILEDLDVLFPLLKEPSASCKNFLNSAREGRLAPYIGASPQDSEHPSEGGGGIRPDGGGGIRPCVRLSEEL